MSLRPPRVSPIAHVPGVFSHYSPETGSALITKVHHYSRVLEAAGGTSYVLVNEARKVGYEAGTVIRFASPRLGGREWFTDRERTIDAGLGAIVGWRPMTARYFEPALAAVPDDAVAVVVYNQPAALTTAFRRHHRGRPVLHLGNDVFARWRPFEVVKALKRFDITVAVSQFTADSIQRRLPASAPTVHVLRNGVDTDQFSPASRPPDGEPEVLFVGNPVPHKGAHLLLEAAHVLVQRGVDFRVRVVGSWGLSHWSDLTSYEHSLRRLAEPLGDRVTFQPFVDRNAIADVYRRARVFCMPVQWDEPAGQVVTEAMASGLPVVAAPRGGIPEYLGPNGTYVDPADAFALADALAPYLLDPHLAHHHGLALRRRAESMSWDARMREFDALLAHEGR